MLTAKLTFTLAARAAIDPIATFQPSEGIEYLHSHDVNGTTLYYFGSPSNAETPPPSQQLHKRCGGNAVTCYYSHTISKPPACQSLLDSLKGSRVSLPKSPRSVCATSDGQQCCVSWADVANGITHGDLYTAGQKVYDQCINNWVIKGSGLARDVQLGSTCTTECVSNRATGCR
ncbi:hypothetical protein PG991_000970 [Apiospora marii]|uniref:WD-like domain-containing protein n=1 Tax=Apiospora marii TaxID=335849 RepID=A0ABR1SV99_9PEZI